MKDTSSVSDSSTPENSPDIVKKSEASKTKESPDKAAAKTPARRRAKTTKSPAKKTVTRSKKTKAKDSEPLPDAPDSKSDAAPEATAPVKKRPARRRKSDEEKLPAAEVEVANTETADEIKESKAQDSPNEKTEGQNRERQRGRGFRDRRGRRGNRNFRGRNRRFEDRSDEMQDDFQNNPGDAESNDSSEEPTEPVFAEGIVEVSGKGFGFLRESHRDYEQSKNDVFVTPEVVREHGLRDGMYIKGETRRGNRGLQLYKLTEIEGRPPTDFQNLPVFEELTTINPIEQIQLETVPDRFTTRVIDLMAPVGKGQRGLIVAPPRTGKTTLLQHIAEAVAKKHPKIKLLVLLVDERPEEVTELRRELPTAELLASSNDSDIKSHTRISQLAIERARRLVEMGYDVFLLMDSITRIGRAFNNARASGGRTMSGGVDSRALEIPRRLFASARNTEEAGSLTIVATALIETGSKMDELIFQEFKGTGNMELVLDRKISDQRIYPAVDIFLSGTRREELLISADALHKISVIRRGLAGHKPIEAVERLIFFMKKYPTNSEMLENIPG